MSKYTTTALEYALRAVKMGTIERDQKGWRFGRRRFSFYTISQLLKTGLVEQRGTTIVYVGDSQAET